MARREKPSDFFLTTQAAQGCKTTKSDFKSKQKRDWLVQFFSLLKGPLLASCHDVLVFLSQMLFWKWICFEFCNTNPQHSYSRVPIRRHGTFIRHTSFIRPNTFPKKWAVPYNWISISNWSTFRYMFVFINLHILYRPRHPFLLFGTIDTWSKWWPVPYIPHTTSNCYSRVTMMWCHPLRLLFFKLCN